MSTWLIKKSFDAPELKNIPVTATHELALAALYYVLRGRPIDVSFIKSKILNNHEELSSNLDKVIIYTDDEIKNWIINIAGENLDMLTSEVNSKWPS